MALHYSLTQEVEIKGKYSGRYATQKITITSYDVYCRFKKYNEYKPYDRQVKPFNFVTVGLGYTMDIDTQEPIIPMLPYVPYKIAGKRNKGFDQIPYLPFIDYKTGKIYDKNTETYWKLLSEVFDEYVNHPESKMDGNIGKMRRKRLSFDKSFLRYIGKEANELEESEVIGTSDSSYVSYDKPHNFTDIVQKMDAKEALKAGISRRHFFRLQSRIKRRGKSLKIHKKTQRKISG